MKERHRDYALRVARRRTEPWTARELDAKIKSKGYARNLFRMWVEAGLAERLPPEPKPPKVKGQRGEPGRPAVRYRMVPEAGVLPLPGEVG